MSYEDAIRISVSIFTPKALSIRRAISVEMLDLLLNRLENLGRETPIAITAALVIKPAGSVNSVRMKSPGWACHSEQNSGNSASFGRPAFVEFCTLPQSWRGTDGQPNLGDGGEWTDGSTRTRARARARANQCLHLHIKASGIQPRSVDVPDEDET